jgi:RimJ/RimL family protein N-acetyltransferase
VHLKTERLLLPPLSERHSAALAEVYAGPDVARYIGGATLDAEGTAAQVARFEAVRREHGFGRSALLDRETGAFLGRAGLHPWPQWGEVELGYVLARHAQGRGLAAEAARAWLDVAFGELGLPRLTAVIHPDNTPSRALATRLGFHVHREDVTPSGVRVLVHELLPVDWDCGRHHRQWWPAEAGSASLDRGSRQPGDRGGRSSVVTLAQCRIGSCSCSSRVATTSISGPAGSAA